MSREEILRAIKEAETKASAMLDKANSDALNIISKARSKAVETIIAGKRDAEVEARAMLDEARGVASNEASAVITAGEAALVAIHENGDNNRSSAIDSVLNTLLE